MSAPPKFAVGLEEPQKKSLKFANTVKERDFYVNQPLGLGEIVGVNRNEPLQNNRTNRQRITKIALNDPRRAPNSALWNMHNTPFEKTRKSHKVKASMLRGETIPSKTLRRKMSISSSYLKQLRRAFLKHYKNAVARGNEVEQERLLKILGKEAKIYEEYARENALRNTGVLKKNEPLYGEPGYSTFPGFQSAKASPPQLWSPELLRSVFGLSGNPLTAPGFKRRKSRTRKQHN